MSIIDIYPTSGYLGNTPMKVTHDFMEIDQEVHNIHKITVHYFFSYDEDPALTISADLYHWEKSEVGQWVMSNAIESPQWNLFTDPATLSTKVVITAKLKEKDAVYFKLKWK